MPAKYNVFGIWDSTIKHFLESFKGDGYLSDTEYADLKEWFYSEGADAFHAFYWEAIYAEAKPFLKSVRTYPAYSLYQILGIKTHAFFQMGLKLDEKLKHDDISNDLLNTIMMSYNSTTTIAVQVQHLFYQLEANILSTLAEFHGQFDPKTGQNYNIQLSQWILNKFQEANDNPARFLKRPPDSPEGVENLRQQILLHIEFIKPSPMLTTPSLSSRSLSPRRRDLNSSPHVSSRGISLIRNQGNVGTPPLNMRQLGPIDHTQRDISSQSHSSTPRSTNSAAGADPTQLRISTRAADTRVPKSGTSFFTEKQRQSSQTLLLSAVNNKASLSPVTGSTGTGSPESDSAAYALTLPGYKS